MLINVLILFYLLAWKLDGPFTINKLQSEPYILLQNTPPKEPKTSTIWAATQARQSLFGDPTATVNSSFNEEPALNNTAHTPAKEIISEIKDNILDNTINEKLIETNNQEEKDEPLLTKNTTVSSSLTPLKRVPPQKNFQKTDKKIRAKVAPKNKETLTLAKLSQGFLDHMKERGNNTLTMLGKEGAQPSAQQLKHERYLQKLNWCLQHSFKIHQQKLPPATPQDLKVELYFALNKNGSIRHLKLVKSSGYQAIDTFVSFIFQDASSSFPPVPEHLPHDPYSMVYVININTKGTIPIRIFK